MIAISKGWRAVRAVLLALIALVNYIIVFLVFGLFVGDRGALYALAFLGALIILSFTRAGEAVLRFNTGARIPTEKERALLEEALDEVLKSSGIKLKHRPGLFVCNDPFPNAFAFGLRTVCVTRSLLHNAPAEELKAVLAHEVGHIANGDTAILLAATLLNYVGMTAAWAITGIVAFFGFVSSFFSELGGYGALAGLPVVILAWVMRAVAWLLYKILELSMLAVGRQAEFAADSFSARAGYRQGLISFLSRDGYPLPKGILARLYASHPDSAARIARLQEI